jgi:hypothetical protein
MENWINHLGIEKLTPAEVILTAPTRYTISHIHTNLEQKISVAIGQVLDCEIKRIRYQIKP